MIEIIGLTELQKKMITDDGGAIKLYISSEIKEDFNDGDCADISFPNGYNKAHRVYKGYSPTLNTTTTKDNFIVKEKTMGKNYRIRKFTPKECFRLMGVKDEDFEKIAKNQSNASLYHLAGDSIVVNVLMEIFSALNIDK